MSAECICVFSFHDYFFSIDNVYTLRGMGDVLAREVVVAVVVCFNTFHAINACRTVVEVEHQHGMGCACTAFLNLKVGLKGCEVITGNFVEPYTVFCGGVEHIVIEFVMIEHYALTTRAFSADVWE